MDLHLRISSSVKSENCARGVAVPALNPMCTIPSRVLTLCFSNYRREHEREITRVLVGPLKKHDQQLDNLLFYEPPPRRRITR
jgi:hypothetical protein